MIKTLGSPFKFFGYYYLNRSSIRHANPINDVRFQRLVITIFGVTGLLLFFKGYYISKHIFYLLVWTEKGCLFFLKSLWKIVLGAVLQTILTSFFVHIRRKWKHVLKFSNLSYERNPLEIEQQRKIDYDCFQTFCEQKKKIHEITNKR